MTGAEAAEAELDRCPPPPLNLTDHAISMRALGEYYAQRDQQQEEADSAA